jgi:hypothetical protein
MNETHTPFTEQEFVDFCREAGFRINHVASLSPIESYLEHYKVDVRPHVKLPERYFLIRAEKM